MSMDWNKVVKSLSEASNLLNEERTASISKGPHAYAVVACSHIIICALHEALKKGLVDDRRYQESTNEEPEV